MLIGLTRPVVRALKHEVSRCFPGSKSSDLSEALARGLGFETNSVLAARVPDPDGRRIGLPNAPRFRLAFVDEQAFLSYLVSRERLRDPWCPGDGLVDLRRRADKAPCPMTLVWKSSVPPVYDRDMLWMDDRRLLTGGNERPILQAVLRIGNGRLVLPESPDEATLIALAEVARRLKASSGEIATVPPGHIAFANPAEGMCLEVAHDMFPCFVQRFLDLDLKALSFILGQCPATDSVSWRRRNPHGEEQGAKPGNPARLCWSDGEDATGVLVWSDAAVAVFYSEGRKAGVTRVRLAPGESRLLLRGWEDTGGPRRERVMAAASRIRDVLALRSSECGSNGVPGKSVLPGL